jgi:prepilin-type processing-associated H-X9-DG protein
MNYMVSLSPSHPALGKPASLTVVLPKEWLNIQLIDPSLGGGIVAASGTWYKLSQITMPTQRCFLADSSALVLEAWQWTTLIPANVTISPPPMGQEPPSQSTSMYSSGINAQTTFDYYRHGVFPPRIQYSDAHWGTGTAFDPARGKVSYNILYFDGHAASTNDMRDAYRTVRMRWPN